MSKSDYLVAFIDFQTQKCLHITMASESHPTPPPFPYPIRKSQYIHSIILHQETAPTLELARDATRRWLNQLCPSSRVIIGQFVKFNN